MREQVLRQQPAPPVTAAGLARVVERAVRRNAPSSRELIHVGSAIGAVTLLLGIVDGITSAGIGLLALVALAVVYDRPYLLAPAVTLLLPASTRLDFLHGQVAPLEAVATAGAAGYLLRLVADRRRPGLRAVHWVFAALVVLIGLSTLGPVKDSTQIHQLVYWSALWVVFYSVTTSLERTRDVRLLIATLALSLLIEAVVTLVEYADTWSSRFSRLHGAIVYPLPKATLEHPNAVAQFLVFAGFALLALVLVEVKALRRAGFAALAVAALALVVTFSRASWIAFVVGAAVYLLDRRTRVPALMISGVVAAGSAVFALVIGGAIGDRISSLFTLESTGLSNFRIEIWRKAAHVAAGHPLTGLGHFRLAGTYAARPDVVNHPHNLFLGVAVFFGIPAAVALALIVLDGLRVSWLQLRNGPESLRFRAIAPLALLVALLVNGIFEYPFWSPSLTALVVLVLAIACARPISARPAADAAG